MPTYRNDTPNTIRVGGRSNGITVEPNESTPIPFFIDPDSGLTPISSIPLVNSQVIYSGELTDETINIPYTERTIIISFYSEDGAVIYLADDSKGIDIHAGVVWNTVETLWKYIGKIKIERSALITVEEVM